MRTKELRSFSIFALVVSLLVLVIFGVLRSLAIETGEFIDWVVGIASFWWLLAIVTIPWNLTFRAREVLHQAELSRERDIPVPERRLKYVRRVAWWTLGLALGLHALSAVGFYLGARFELVSVGYVCSALAMALTLLRPSWRGLEYVQRRLATIEQEVHFPRDDIATLQESVDTLRERLEAIAGELDPLADFSFRARTEDRLGTCERELRALTSEFETFEREEAAARARMEAEVRASVRKLSEDSQFLGHVREIIRFVRDA